MVALPRDEIHLLVQDVALPEVPEPRVRTGRTRACRSTRACVRLLSRTTAAPRRPESHPLILGRPLHALEEDAATKLALHLQETLLLASPTPSGAMHVLAVDTEAQREVEAGARRCRATPLFAGPPPRWKNSDELGSSRLLGNESQAQKHCWLVSEVEDG